MRPEISALMDHFYGVDLIRNHPVVSEYPPVRGLTTNMCFIDHCHAEVNESDNKSSTTDGGGGTRSKTNLFEAEYVSALCYYLVKQEYAEAHITVLTMYLGQLAEVKKRLRAIGLRYATRSHKIYSVGIRLLEKQTPFFDC